LAPEQIGKLLRNTGISCKRKAKGSTLNLDNAVCLQTHELALRHQAAAVQEGIRKCSLCEEVFSAEKNGQSKK
jgi:hypothetical protein